MSSQVLAAVLEQEGQRWLEPHLNHQVRFQLQQLPGALSTAKLQESAPTHPAQTSRAAAASATAHLAAREKKKKSLQWSCFLADQWPESTHLVLECIRSDIKGQQKAEQVGRNLSLQNIKLKIIIFLKKRKKEKVILTHNNGCLDSTRKHWALVTRCSRKGEIHGVCFKVVWATKKITMLNSVIQFLCH